MRILHLSHSYTNGGAAIAAKRIHLSVKPGVVSKMLVNDECSEDDEDVINISNNKFERLKTKIKNYLETKLKKLAGYKDGYSSLSIFKSGIIKNNKALLDNSDIIHLHWINRSLISVEEIGEIKKPIIWTLHDMWMFSGARHYSKSTKEDFVINNLVEKIMCIRKINAWKKLKMQIVVPSRWMELNFKKSLWSKYFDCVVIPNPIDLKIWKPKEVEKSKRALGLCKNSRIILFGAIGGTGDRRKGFSYLESALKLLTDKCKGLENIILVTFGGPELKKINGVNVFNYGEVKDINFLTAIYSAADVFVSPSIQETFGQTSLESLACGTPVVAFDETGTEDLIHHKLNGYLAKNGCINDLIQGIIWGLETTKNKRKVVEDCIKSVEKFNSDNIGEQYKKLYMKMLLKV